MRFLLLYFVLSIALSTAAEALALPFVTLSEVVKRHGFKVEEDVRNSVIRLRSATTRVDIVPNLKGVLIDGRYFDLGAPIVYRGGKLVLPAAFLKALPWPKQLLPTPAAVVEGKFKVVLDAGHGGKDPGAIGQSGVREKDIVLAITKKVGALLAQNPAIEVYYTRSSDIFIPLAGRGLVANKVGADIFVSIHANASASPKTRGTDIFYVSPSYDDWERATEMDKRYRIDKRFAGEMDSDLALYESRIYHLFTQHHRDMAKKLATAIQTQFKQGVGSVDRGVKQARFHVLRMAPCPSVLVETGFLTNREEAALLATQSYQDKLARAIAEAVTRSSTYWR